MALSLRLLVQSRQVAVGLYSLPCGFEPVRVWWLSAAGWSGRACDSACPYSFGQSSLIAASAPLGRSAAVAQAHRHHATGAVVPGPLPMQSAAFTWLVLKKARHCLRLEPGIEDSAMSVQILSAPASPSVWP